MKAATGSWKQLAQFAGRNDMPALLIRSWPHLSRTDQRSALADAWTMPEWPEQHILGSRWINLFDQVGYLVDGEATRWEDDLPPRITLWRGCTVDRMHGLSWTTSRETARWFATRFDGMRDAEDTLLVRITVPRDLVLARFTLRGEDEHVVDTDQVGEDEPAIEERWWAGERTGERAGRA